MATIIEWLGLKFWMTQYRFGRKYFGGKWYHINVRGLSMAPFWSDTEITSCQAETLETEQW